MTASELTVVLKPDTTLLDAAFDRAALRIAEVKAEVLAIKGMSADIDDAVDEVIFELEHLPSTDS